MTGIEDRALLELLKLSFPSTTKKFKAIKEEFEHFCEHKFRPQIMKNYEKLNTSTSQLFRNKGFKIDELYVPLTIVNTTTRDKVQVNSYPEELFDNCHQVLINDSAGMGKSTVLKMIYRYAIEDAKAVPFYIDLKSLIRKDEALNVEDFILSTFPTFTKAPSRDFWLKLLDNSKLLFLFDGADEVPDSMKEQVFERVKQFCMNASNSNFIIASRSEDKILSAFFDFNSHFIQPLKKKEAHSLLKKYEFNDVKADDLITELEKTKNKPVQEFLSNPLLTTLLYTAYVYKKKIPLKKSLFYGQVYSALYENHDATKIGYLTREKRSGLDIDDFETILSHLAYLSRPQEQLEYTFKELHTLITDIATKHPTIEFSVRGFIEDLTTRVPILRKDGLSYYWQHKSIQEYFFVRFLFTVMDENGRKTTLKSIIDSKNAIRYKLILDIVHDENEELFHDIITTKVVQTATENWNEKNTSNTINTINCFYRYIAGPLKKILPNEGYEQKKKLKGMDYFKGVGHLVQELYLPAGFIPTGSSLNHGFFEYYTHTFERPETVALSVLFEKKAEFIDEVTIERDDSFLKSQSDDELPVVNNINSSTDLSDLKFLRRRKNPFYSLDLKAAQEFLKRLQTTKKEREALFSEFEY